VAADTPGGVAAVGDVPRVSALTGLPAVRDGAALAREPALRAVAGHRTALAGVTTSARTALAVAADSGDGTLPVTAVANRSALCVVHRVPTVALVPVRRVPTLTGVVHGLSTLTAIPTVATFAPVSAVRSLTALTAVVRVMVMMSLTVFLPVVMVVMSGVPVAAEVIDEGAQQGHQFAFIETTKPAATVGRSALRDQITAGLRPAGKPALVLRVGR
jgi:hypothetical protein